MDINTIIKNNDPTDDNLIDNLINEMGIDSKSMIAQKYSMNNGTNLMEKRKNMGNGLNNKQIGRQNNGISNNKVIEVKSSTPKNGSSINQFRD